MKLKLKKPFIKTIDTITWLAFEVPNDVNLDKLNKLIEKEFYEVEIKEFKEKRSLTANGYLFVLLTKLAAKLGNSLGNQYVIAIKSYGVFIEGMIFTEQAYNSFCKAWDNQSTKVQHDISMVDEVRRFDSKGINYVECLAYNGSSEYDSKQFSILLEGVVNDCIEQNIEVLPPHEVERLIKEYGGNDG